ncbi:MAG: iron oxidase [Acidimicrobiales bacterium]|nr:iron oxidase [Acidimicrobiales bacterium]
MIDVGPLVSGHGDAPAVGHAIDRACRQDGFFYITGHGVDEAGQRRLEQAAWAFFGQPDDAKAAIAMHHGGRAWRGWFPPGGELTSGAPDRKEGLYFGAELGPDDPRVAAGLALHGPNLFPDHPPELRPAVLDHIAALTRLGHALARGLALGLGLDEAWFDRQLTADPLVLFRIFHYPAADHRFWRSKPAGGAGSLRQNAKGQEWGVGEHTDYGLLTILRQDDVGGLQVRSRAGWIDVPPIPGTFVCNIGDMLDRMTGGRYRSTPHRVKAAGPVGRLSFPFFFDPGWDAQVHPIPLPGSPPPDDAATRWDRSSVHALEGTYGEYLLAKVSKVFPALRAQALEDRPPPA